MLWIFAWHLSSTHNHLDENLQHCVEEQRSKCMTEQTTISVNATTTTTTTSIPLAGVCIPDLPRSRGGWHIALHQCQWYDINPKTGYALKDCAGHMVQRLGERKQLRNGLNGHWHSLLMNRSGESFISSLFCLWSSTD